MTIRVCARASERLRRVASWFRVQRARATGVRIGRGCRVASRCEVALGTAKARIGEIVIDSECTLAEGVILHPHGGSVRLRNNVYVGPYTVVYGHGAVEIGPDTLISMHCRILSSEHSIPPPSVVIRSESDRRMPTRLGRDVWLGAGVTVLGGVTIGDGCVVGAGAVVSSDLPSNSIALGVPARVVRQRE